MLAWSTNTGRCCLGARWAMALFFSGWFQPIIPNMAWVGGPCSPGRSHPMSSCRDVHLPMFWLVGIGPARHMWNYQPPMVAQLTTPWLLMRPPSIHNFPKDHHVCWIPCHNNRRRMVIFGWALHWSTTTQYHHQARPPLHWSAITINVHLDVPLKLLHMIILGHPPKLMDSYLNHWNPPVTGLFTLDWHI